MGIAIVLIALVLALGVGALRLRVQSRRLAGELSTLRAETSGLSGLGLAPERGDRLITVRILNPLELATEKTKAAGLLHKVRPQLVNKLVYEQAAKELVDRLAEEGVRAEVRVHAGH